MVSPGGLGWGVQPLLLQAVAWRPAVFTLHSVLCQLVSGLLLGDRAAGLKRNCVCRNTAQKQGRRVAGSRGRGAVAHALAKGRATLPLMRSNPLSFQLRGDSKLIQCFIPLCARSGLLLFVLTS